MLVQVGRLTIIAIVVATILGLLPNLSATALAQATEGFVDSSDGVALYYRVVGTGGDTIVVVHGGPGMDQGYLAPDLEYLSDSFTLIFYDQRGVGRSTLISDPAHIHLDGHVADLDNLRRYFAIDRLVLLGHSWGAAPAAWYARAHSDRVAGLILVGPLPSRRVPHWAEYVRDRVAWQNDETQARVQELTAAQDTASDWWVPCRALYEISVRGVMHDPRHTEAIAGMRGDRCAASAEAMRNARIVNALNWASIGDWDWREEFRNVHVPVLVVHGASDPMPLASSREWAEAFPNGRIVVLDRAGHYPHLERPEDLRRLIQEFLRFDGTTGSSTR